MQHQTQYWLTCPACGHQMEVGKLGGPLRAKYCDKCHLLFSPPNEELAVAESVGTADSVGNSSSDSRVCVARMERLTNLLAAHND
jgi:hypothetical protein